MNDYMIMLLMPRQVGRRYDYAAHATLRPRSMSLSSSVDEIDQQELLLIALNIMTVVHISTCVILVCFF